MSINPNQPCVRVRIKNIKSGRYLSLEGGEPNWCNDGASLTIRDWLNLDVLESPQIWHIIQYRQEQWIMVNQYSKNVACIRGRSKSNDATAVQYPTQCLVGDNEPFQEWNFTKLENGNYLIQNVNSEKYLGPQNRSVQNDQYCIQYDNQTSEDSYQEWVFEEM